MLFNNGGKYCRLQEHTYLLFIATLLTWYFIYQKVGFKEATSVTNGVFNCILYKPYFMATKVILNIQAKICKWRKELLKLMDAHILVYFISKVVHKFKVYFR